MIDTGRATATASGRPPRLFLPGQVGYDRAAPWNRAMVSEPAAVVRARTAADISDALSFAANRHLTVAVRSSGHGAVPLDSSTLLIHTSRMTDILIDADRRVARIGAGAPWQPVVDAAARFGLAAICGSAPGVGAVGYLTGGGIGPLCRTFGVSSDFVRALDVVVGDGRILRATPHQHEDLFWGLRGGKATLGLVTAVDIDLVPLESFYGGSLWFDAGSTRSVLAAWHRMCAELPDEATSSAAIMRLPQTAALPPAIAGRQTLAIRFGSIGDPAAGDRLLAGVRRAGTTVFADVGLRPYPQIGAIHRDPVAPAATTQRSALLDDITDEAVDALIDATGPDGNRQNIVELRHLGGVIDRDPRHASAVCHRRAAYSLFVAGSASPDGVTAVRKQASDILAALAPWTGPGLLPNFAAGDDPAEVRRCYDAETHHWLQELGDHYDPNHLLHTGQVDRRPRPGA